METLLMYGFGDSPLNNKYQEILKLEDMLNKANVPHVLKRMFDGWQVCYPSDDEKDMVMDAIEHFGSFGKELAKLVKLGNGWFYDLIDSGERVVEDLQFI